MRTSAAIKLMGFGLVASLLSVDASGAAEKDFVIKIATLAPQGSAWTRTFDELNREVAEATDKRVRFKVYPGGVLGDERDMLRKMHIGQLQGAALTAAGLSNLFQEIDVFQIPFLFRTYQEVDHILSKMNDFFKKGFEASGYVLLGWSEAGFVYLMSTEPILTLKDLRRMRVWIWADSPMAKAIFEEAEIAAIPLSVPDVLVGLQTGLVDVVYAPPTGAISLQWFTRLKYMTDVPLIYLIGGVVVRKDVLRRMPETFQEEVRGAFRRHMTRLKAVIRKQNEEAVQVMVKHGVKVLKPSTDQIEQFKALSDRAMQRLGKQTFSREVLTEVSSRLADYRGAKQ